MDARTSGEVRAAQIVLPCVEIDETLDFFTERLGFRVAAIYPADDPRVVVVSGYGLRIQLQRGGDGEAGVVRLLCNDPARVASGATELVAPNGTRIELVDADPPIEVPHLRPSFVLSRMGDRASWGKGRAGMRYRDLIPDRQGGSFIASHIRIPDGGPVPDYVHYHKVRFQMIYCYRGWVRVVYEDQGEPFVMQAGDCVLQPPRIRHRVLESSPGLEVIELGCPAEHETFGDLEMTLPTTRLDPNRDFSGQRFVRHEAAKATWRPFRIDGFEYRDTGIGVATDGLAGVRVARVSGKPSEAQHSHDAELLFHFVLEGMLTLQYEDKSAERLAAGDAFVIPAAKRYAFEDCSQDVEILEVSIPAEVQTS